eukprot:TRINITY_DN15020_c0_g1_i1.p1 TRINITY_DN15020_c0_g1~~TRINITY_DN15020_c0_g1_i1.p1  ORF type:complete len:189 (+),score=40.81 TRINITY_DN15020_c0_g1_i1:268-834(+)
MRGKLEEEQLQTDIMEDGTILQLMNSWLEEDATPFSPRSYQSALASLEVLTYLLHDDTESERVVLLLAFYYANNFIKKYHRLEDRGQVLDLLQTSLLVTRKFWADLRPNMDEVSQFFQLPKATVCALERKFLTVLDFELFISPKTDIEEEMRRTVLIHNLKSSRTQRNASAAARGYYAPISPNYSITV